MAGSGRKKRTTDSIAEFNEGYALDWAFAVPTCFRPALDIVLAERVRDGARVHLWTQGNAYAFRAGDTLHYAHRPVPSDWAEALQHIQLTVQVKDAVAASDSEGFVHFQAYKPDLQAGQLVPSGVHECTQREFVALLRHGALSTPDGDTPATDL